MCQRHLLKPVWQGRGQQATAGPSGGWALYGFKITCLQFSPQGGWRGDWKGRVVSPQIKLSAHSPAARREGGVSQHVCVWSASRRLPTPPNVRFLFHFTENNRDATPWIPHSDMSVGRP